MEKATINLVVVGDHDCGRTSLLIVIKENRFPDEYIPSVYKTYVVNKVIDGVDAKVGLWDTKSGGEDYYRLRPLSYSNRDAILLCFSLAAPAALENINNTWFPELQIHCPKVPIILIGNKMDLRNDQYIISKFRKLNREPITKQEGYDMAKKIKAYTYLECSSKTKEGVHEVIEVAARAGMDFNTRIKRNKCFLL